MRAATDAIITIRTWAQEGEAANSCRAGQSRCGSKESTTPAATVAGRLPVTSMTWQRQNLDYGVPLVCTPQLAEEGRHDRASPARTSSDRQATWPLAFSPAR